MLDKNNNSRLGRSQNNQKRKLDISMSAKVKKSRLVVPPIHDRGSGTLHTFGTGDCGQLGLDKGINKRNYPCPVPGLGDNKILQVAAGGMHTVALDDGGVVWTFGLNDDLALGRKTESEEQNFSAGKVNLKQEKIVQISAGDSHSAALSETGQVFIWGTFKDMNGSFGLIPGHDKLCWDEPQLISEHVNAKVFKIASGDNHLVMLTEDGKIFTCGTGEQGQLGRSVVGLDERRVTRSQSVTTTRDSLLTPTEVKIRKKFRDVWCGSFSTYCRTERNSEIWVFGLNNYFQLGISNVDIVRQPHKSTGFIESNKWTQIAAGMHHAVALDEEGKVYTLGRGNDGRLGLGIDNAPEALAVPTLVPGLSERRCVQVAAGLSTAYAVTSTGQIYAWGFGGNYQLGRGSTDDLHNPTAIAHIVLDGSKQAFAPHEPIYVSAGGQHVSLTIKMG